VNASTRPAVASVTFAPSSATAVHLVHPTSVNVPAQSALTLPVSLAGLKKLDAKISGVLLVSGGGAPAVKSVTVTPAPQPAADWPKLFAYGTVGVIAGLWLAIVLVALVAGKGAELANRAPGPRWSFESWAAIFTATAALVGTLLGSATLPEVPRQINKETLVAFSMLFASLAVIAPFLFQTIRSPGASASDQESGLWGFNLSLLLACSMSCAAALGELGVLALIAWELIGGGGWAWTVVICLGVLALLGLYYFLVTGWSLATADWAAIDAARPRAGVAERAAGAPQALRPGVQAPLSWRLP
jgi:hypothetical protein